MAAPAFAFTISRAAEILGRGRATLVGLSRRDASGERLSLGSMAPRISRRLPSRPAGMEYLRDLLAEHKRNRPPAVLNGWFPIICADDLCSPTLARSIRTPAPPGIAMTSLF